MNHSYGNLVGQLMQSEAEVIAKDLAMAEIMLARMVPRFEKDCIPKFQALAWKSCQNLAALTSMSNFDTFHAEFVAAFRSQIRAVDGGLASYRLPPAPSE